MSEAQRILDMEEALQQALSEGRTTDAIELRANLRIAQDLQRAREHMAACRCFMAIVPEDLRSN